MKRNVMETVLGAVVLIVAVIFLGFSYSAADVGSKDGYSVTADFSGTGGLNIGDSVQISGVKIGNISKIVLKPDDYMARVTMNVQKGIQLPDDTSAFISSEGLLGGKYMELQPGASDEMLAENGHIQYTQAPQNLEQLLGKFIFSMEGANKGAGEESTAGAETAPAAHAADAPAAADHP